MLLLNTLFVILVLPELPITAPVSDFVNPSNPLFVTVTSPVWLSTVYEPILLIFNV